ncbi:hypothetical protein PM082_024354 [Marasmius tenuissimus]|nr:hypothetical protein PM082_024354 [Marasmius tenuissimus]
MDVLIRWYCHMTWCSFGARGEVDRLWWIDTERGRWMLTLQHIYRTDLVILRDHSMVGNLLSEATNRADLNVHACNQLPLVLHVPSPVRWER